MSTTLTDLAKDREFEIRQQLEQNDIFFELNLDEDEIRRVQELYGRLAAQDLRLGTYEGLIKRYPALTLTTLVGHAGLAYEQGRYWESFWDELGLDQDAQFEAVLRHSLADLMRKFKLREFPDLAGNYVLVMAMHAGIPVYCLGDLVDVIEDHVRSGRNANGAALLEWLTAPRMEYRLSRLDVPVRNFLSYGGDVVVDILDRIIELLLFTLDQPEVWNNLELNTSTTGLPALVLNGLIDRLRERPFLSSDSKASRRIRNRRGPTVSYAVSEDEVRISVPYPESSPETPWKISVGGNTRDVYAERAWGAEDDAQPPTLVTVTEAARDVTAIHSPSDASYVIDLFSSADPLLIFTVDGRLVQRHSSLPRGHVLALFPKDALVIDTVSRRPVRSVAELRTPSGWIGWEVHTLDLSDHDAICVYRNTTDGPSRAVRSRKAPIFQLPDRAAGLFTPNGLSVYRTRPSIDLPASSGPDPVVWRVRVRKVGDRQWASDCEWESDTAVTYLDPFEGIDSALLGLYEIVVSGQLGADQRYQLFIAEGVGLRDGTRLRLPVPGGLEELTTEVISDEGLPVNPAVVEWSSDLREKRINVGPLGHRFQLILRPPQFEFRIDATGVPAEWRGAAVSLNPVDLEEHRLVTVRAPGQPAMSIGLVGGGGDLLQIETADRQESNTFQIPTRRFVDTARRAGYCQLVAILNRSSALERRVPVAEIRPTNLCGSVSLVNDQLLFGDLAQMDDLAVWVWSATAPWQPLTRLDIVGSCAALPPRLQGAGDLIVQVFADDPFVVIARPRRPDRSAIRITQPGWTRDEDPALDQVARYLAGEGRPPLVAEATGAAWSALAILPWDRTDGEMERLRGGLIRIVGKHPRASLEALGESSLLQEEMLSLLITTHLIERPYAASFTLNELHQNPWVGCMIEISDLPSLYDRRSSVSKERAETLAYLSTQGGTELIALLRCGKMSDPRRGVFQQGDVVFASKDADEMAAIYEVAKLVPGPLLDGDSRTAAAFDAFFRRTDWAKDPVSREVSSHVSRLLREVKNVAPAMYELVEQRDNSLTGVDCAEHPWMLLPMQSLTFAAVARLDARAEFEYSPMTPEARRAWQTMADYFPAMVACDLLIAEALASHLEHGDLIGEPE